MLESRSSAPTSNVNTGVVERIEDHRCASESPSTPTTADVGCHDEPGGSAGRRARYDGPAPLAHGQHEVDFLLFERLQIIEQIIEPPGRSSRHSERVSGSRSWHARRARRRSRTSCGRSAATESVMPQPIAAAFVNSSTRWLGDVFEAARTISTTPVTVESPMGPTTGPSSSTSRPDSDPSGRPRHARCRVGSAAGLGDGRLATRRETLQPTVHMNTIPALRAAPFMCSTRCSQRAARRSTPQKAQGRENRDADLSPRRSGGIEAPGPALVDRW